jgi:hypothetical protein
MASAVLGWLEGLVAWLIVLGALAVFAFCLRAAPDPGLAVKEQASVLPVRPGAGSRESEGRDRGDRNAEEREHAAAAAHAFAADYGAKWPKAVVKITDDVDELLIQSAQGTGGSPASGRLALPPSAAPTSSRTVVRHRQTP